MTWQVPVFKEDSHEEKILICHCSCAWSVHMSYSNVLFTYWPSRGKSSWRSYRSGKGPVAFSFYAWICEYIHLKPCYNKVPRNWDFAPPSAAKCTCMTDCHSCIGLHSHSKQCSSTSWRTTFKVQIHDLPRSIDADEGTRNMCLLQWESFILGFCSINVTVSNFGWVNNIICYTRDFVIEGYIMLWFLNI